MIDFTRKYPHIPFRRNWTLDAELRELLARTAERIRFLGQLPVLPQIQKELLVVDLVKGAHATTAIEGNTLTEEDVRRIYDGKPVENLRADYLHQEVSNMLDALNHCLKTACFGGAMGLIDDELLKNMHRSVGKGLGELFEAIPGEYRRNNVTVGPYRAPDYDDVPDLMKLFFNFMRQEFHYESGKQTTETAILQAIVAHVYLELIHPFGDGNGRTGRLLEYWLLLRGFVPAPCAHLMANHYNLTRAQYFQELRQAKDNEDFTAFIRYAVEGLYLGLNEVEKKLLDSQWQTVWERHVYQTFDQNEDKFSEKPRRRRVRSLALLLPINESFAFSEIPFKSPGILELYRKVSSVTLERDVEALWQLKLLRRDDENPEKYRLDTDGMSFHRQPKRD